MDNKGYSLVEMIVVLTILAILATFTFSGMEYLNHTNVTKAVNEIDSYMDKVRTESMTKAQSTYALVISSEEDGYYLSIRKNDGNERIDSVVKGTQIGNKRKIGNQKITITYQNDGLETEYTVNENNPLIITYHGYNGSYSSNCSNISIANGNRVKEIYLVKKTGKHFVK